MKTFYPTHKGKTTIIGKFTIKPEGFTPDNRSDEKELEGYVKNPLMHITDVNYEHAEIPSQIAFHEAEIERLKAILPQEKVEA